MKYYSKDKLLLVAKHRGYVTQKAIADGLSPIFGLSSATINNKLSTGNLTKEECEVIGSYFEMSMKEYYDVFMNGLFVIDREGHFVCQVENPYVHLHPNHIKDVPSGQVAVPRVDGLKERKRRKTAEEILNDLANL